MLMNILVLLALCLCFWIGARMLTRRTVEPIQCTPRDLAQILSDSLVTMRAGSVLHATNTADPAHEFCFLKGQDTGTLQQNILFALVEPQGEDKRFEQAVEVMRRFGVPMEVESTRTQSGSARVLAVPLYGTAERIAGEADRLVAGIVADSDGQEEARFEVVTFGRVDRAVRRRTRAARAARSAGLLLHNPARDP